MTISRWYRRYFTIVVVVALFASHSYFLWDHRGLCFGLTRFGGGPLCGFFSIPGQTGVAVWRRGGSVIVGAGVVPVSGGREAGMNVVASDNKLIWGRWIKF